MWSLLQIKGPFFCAVILPKNNQKKVQPKKGEPKKQAKYYSNQKVPITHIGRKNNWRNITRNIIIKSGLENEKSKKTLH